MKYTKVRTAIIPFILAFKLAEPGVRKNGYDTFDVRFVGTILRGKAHLI